MKSSISRSAAWRLFHYAEEKPNKVVAALDDKTEAVIGKLEAGTRRRAVRCAVDGIISEATYVFMLRQLSEDIYVRKMPAVMY
jgi:hypothetical protein